jgi:hypothetical protein
MEGWKKRWKRPTFFRFSVFFDILQIVKHVGRKSVAFQVLAMNLLRRNVVQNARKSDHVQKCMGSVILQFSSMKKVGPQNMWHQEKVLLVDMGFFQNAMLGKKSHVDMRKFHVNMGFFSSHMAFWKKSHVDMSHEKNLMLSLNLFTGLSW